jgi:glycine/D-amino acid oxidase-like deaminating enzyme
VSHTPDVVIVGAGIIGGSVAFHRLERDPRLRVVMLEALSLDRFAAGRLRAEANMF